MSSKLQIDIPGKPKPKSRPRMVRGRIWTPSTPHENMVAAYMLPYQKRFEGRLDLAFLVWFYGADPRADLDNLLKLCVDACVKADVIDGDNTKTLVYVSAEARRVDNEGNPFPNKPSTRIRIGGWKD